MSLVDVIARSDALIKKCVPPSTCAACCASSATHPASADATVFTLHRYEKYAAEKPEAAAKSKDPFNNAYTEVLERINELTLVQRCAAASKCI